jgi:hypothetical protein
MLSPSPSCRCGRLGLPAAGSFKGRRLICRTTCQPGDSDETGQNPGEKEDGAEGLEAMVVSEIPNRGAAQISSHFRHHQEAGKEYDALQPGARSGETIYERPGYCRRHDDIRAGFRGWSEQYRPCGKELKNAEQSCPGVVGSPCQPPGEEKDSAAASDSQLQKAGRRDGVVIEPEQMIQRTEPAAHDLGAVAEIDETSSHTGSRPPRAGT